jgi:effector-binding domain-containing protein
MLTEPQIVTKQDQPYAAMVLTLSQPEIANVAPPLIDDVIAWVKAHGGRTTGAPFFNYVNFFPDGKMEMQVGMPTDTVLKPDGTISTGTLPGGKYASITATVPYHELHDANMKLHDWTVTKGHKLDGTEEGDRFINANRMEIYHKDPGEDPSGHPVTEVAFRLAQ